MKGVGKMQNETKASVKDRKSMKTKALLLAGVIALGANAAVGGTLAWLISKTDPAVNTFTYGDINIDLDESDSGDNDGDPNTNTYDMVPGNSITKDPLITVEADSEDCWLFVKLDKSENFDDFMEYAIAEGWTELTGNEGVYYREVTKSDEELQFYVLEGNQVTVSPDVTKEMLNALDAVEGEETYPTLTVSAYAVQRDAAIEAIDTVEEAWALAQE